jgi:hypothetical protein
MSTREINRLPSLINKTEELTFTPNPVIAITAIMIWALAVILAINAAWRAPV